MKKFTNAISLMFIGLAGLAPDPAASQGRDNPEAVIRIADRIRRELLRLPNYGVFDHLSFSLANSPDGYRVTLKGYASRPTLKDSAARVLNDIEQISAVDNQIEVLSLSRMDEDIRLAAYARIYFHPTLSRYNPNRGSPVYGSLRGWTRAAQMGISNDPPPGVHPVSIIVKQGTITLEGVVDNETDKNLAGMLANQVPGAFAVTNNLATARKGRAKAK